MICPNCGEALVGDGYSLVLHCPRVDVTGSGLEPDANPVYCSAEKDTGEQLLDLLASWLEPGVNPSPEGLNKAYQLAGQLSATLDETTERMKLDWAEVQKLLNAVHTVRKAVEVQSGRRMSENESFEDFVLSHLGHLQLKVEANERETPKYAMNYRWLWRGE